MASAGNQGTVGGSAIPRHPWVIMAPGYNFLRFLIGLAAGLLGGLIGVGGGVVMIPLMVRCFKFSQHQGHGTSLMARSSPA